MTGDYLLGGRLSELERLQLQARVWEPSGRSLLARLGEGAGSKALDVGCGAMGLLRPLSEWVGDDGMVVGTDVDERLLDAAASFVDAEALPNVTLVEDDLFASALDPASFDLVHVRFQLAPLGRVGEQLEAYLRLVRPGGWLVLEEPDSASWRFNPPGTAAERLVAAIVRAFAAVGGDFDVGRTLPSLLRAHGVQPEVEAHVIALPPEHPYLRLPLQFASSLEPHLLRLLGADELGALRTGAEAELADAERWGTTFTLVQGYGRVNERRERRAVDPRTSPHRDPRVEAGTSRAGSRASEGRPLCTEPAVARLEPFCA